MRSTTWGAVAILTLCTAVGFGRPAVADQDDSTQNQSQQQTQNQDQQGQNAPQNQTQPTDQAQPTQNTATQSSPSTGQNGRWEREFTRFTKELGLTEDQQEKIRPLFQNQGQQIEAVRTDKTLSRRERMTKIREIRATTQDQIKSFLSTEQLQKWNKMRGETGDTARGTNGYANGDDTNNTNWRRHRRGNAPVTWQERFQQFSKTLKLTEDQQEKIQPLFQDEDQQITAVFDNTGLSKEDQTEKVKAIRQATEDKIEPLLTPDQMEKWGEWKQKSADRAQERGQWETHRRGQKTASWKEQFNRLNSAVNLTDEQKEKIKPILQDEARQITTLNKDKTLSEDARESAIRDVKKSTWTQIQSLLTPAQIEKLGALREEAQDRAEDQKPSNNNQNTNTNQTNSGNTDNGNTGNGSADSGNTGNPSDNGNNSGK